LSLRPPWVPTCLRQFFDLSGGNDKKEKAFGFPLFSAKYFRQFFDFSEGNKNEKSTLRFKVDINY